MSEGVQSEVLRRIAYKLEELAMLVGSDGGIGPDTPEDRDVKREATVQDINACTDEGGRAKDACKASGVKDIMTCIAIGKIAEGKCLESKLKDPDRK